MGAALCLTFQTPQVPVLELAVARFAFSIGANQKTGSVGSHMTQHAINAEPLVFVVDDDIDVREGLKSLMGSVGLRCEVFASPRKFLEREAADTLSCLVLDVRLPEMGGLDFQAELAGTHADIRIIFITGHGDVPMSVKAMKAGAVEFLTKPVREQTLLDAVRDA